MAQGKKNRTKDIPTQIKNPELVIKRRQQIAEAAIDLFIKNGFHKTTTRQIAGATGFSIGSLYEYVASKEDILFIVCDTIHVQVEKVVSNAMNQATGKKGRDVLFEVIREYFLVCNKMCDEILLIYQETRSLPSQWQRKILENELNITGIFVKVLAELIAAGKIRKMTESEIDLVAHNICVLGHMWTFRRWFLSRHYSIDDYIHLQAEFILGFLEEHVSR